MSKFYAKNDDGFGTIEPGFVTISGSVFGIGRGMITYESVNMGYATHDCGCATL
jgi:hypothetical protein